MQTRDVIKLLSCETKIKTAKNFKTITKTVFPHETNTTLLEKVVSLTF